MRDRGTAVYGSMEMGAAVLHQLDTHQGIDTVAEVTALRVPGERRVNAKSATASKMSTALAALAVTFGKQWISRKRVRSDALRLLRESAYS